MILKRLCWPLLWALAVGSSAALYQTQIGWSLDAELLLALLPYVAGAFAGGWFGWAFAEHVSSTKPPATRFAAFFAFTAVMTLGFAAFFYYLQQRAYFAQWHAQIFSLEWLFQVVFTGFGSAYLFLATGLRPLLPWAVIVLALASYSFSRGRFPASH